jgi:hypothetical protein
MSVMQCQGNNEHERGTMYIHPHHFACISMEIAVQIGYMGDISEYAPISCLTITSFFKNAGNTFGLLIGSRKMSGHMNRLNK